MKPSDILALLATHGFRARRSLGQNFLVDPNLLQAVANSGDVGANDAIIEVGTGAGTFTAVLAARAARVVTFELDPRLGDVAREVVGAAGPGLLERVTFVAGDALDGPHGLHPAIEEAAAAAARDGLTVKCVSNFPYAIATPLFIRLLERSAVERAFPLAAIAGTVQREVAARLTARGISKDYGAPSVLTQALAEVTVERRIAPGAFVPPPKVESAVIRIRPRPAEALPSPADYARLRAVVRAIFQYRRKTVKNALERGLGVASETAGDALRHAGIDPTSRVEALSVRTLSDLARAIPVDLDARPG